ncbi:MAG: glycosyltransferase, partial [Verrucomicrobiae bacterium]|nr:glycosyltransferase [Verrucomicrobiae bacterium]
AARGSIVVYTDDDCEADPDWLTWLAYGFSKGEFVAMGGPNIPPPPRTRVPAMVAAAPGGPAHVLANDLEAEHLPGCNLAVRREALEAIGGFDTQFWTAGDDVDFCWRLIDAGWRIGFHPAAMVWHHRRFKIKAYLKQQLGYGRAEAMLMPVHPGRFGLRGGARWSGRVYLESPGARLATSGARIYYGPLGYAPFQALYGDGSAHSPAALLLDWLWLSMAAVLMILGILFGLPLTGGAGLAMLLASVLRGVLVAGRSEPWARFDGVVTRAGVAILALIQGPLRSGRRSVGVIDWFRSRGEKGAVESLTRVSESEAPRACGFLPWSGISKRRDFWSERGVDRHDWLMRFEEEVKTAGLTAESPDAEDRSDVQIRIANGWLARVVTASEYHEQGRILLRVRVSFSPSQCLAMLGGVAVILLALIAASGSLETFVLGLVIFATILGFQLRKIHRLDVLIERAARSLGLSPM